ncbi:RDD family protein [Streptomyces actinomycinicus]|uniref:RDD family protein n=1 Tax=Streptomyces actinomycinicus TaxID=1695166 RepID=A0A937ECV5_9ACTN|nr:RDD family protein [Streptomyces actinomycinicus]MBL1080391.1 RDD family protein [Streptomyces actinomycinicus]
MSAPTPAPGDDRPREGYYPDPSIPGYVRYWNGASWVPGTSRPAPQDGEPLTPPPGVRPAPPSVEETGPHFFDEDPADPLRQDPAAQQGHPGRSGEWAQQGRSAQAAQGGQGAQWAPAGGAWPADPRVPADSPGHSEGRATSRTDGTATIPPAESDAPDPGTFIFRRPIPGPAARTDDGTMTFRPVPPGPSGGGGPSGAEGTPPGGSGPAGFGAQGPVGAPSPSSAGPSAAAPPSSAPAGNPGFGAGKAAAARATTPAPRAPEAPADAAGTPHVPKPAPAPHGGQPSPAAATPSVPQQAGPQQAGPRPAGFQQPGLPQPGLQQPGLQQAGAQQAAASATPLTSGPGGGQASWAQQVHRLAGGGDEQPVAPWKPPVEDPFQAAARRQAAARPAGLGRRLAARLIDVLAVGALTAAAAVPLGIRAVDHVQEKIDAARLSGREVTVWLLDGTTGTSLGIVLAVLLLAGVLCEVLPTVKWGRTLGKKLCGLEVRDIEAHEPPTFGPALRRWLVFSVPGLLGIGLVGVLWCLFDRPWRQCWHDKAAHTFVAG